MTIHNWKVKHADEIDTLEELLHSFMGPKPKKLWLHNNIINMDIPAYFECNGGVIYNIIRMDVDPTKYNCVMFKNYTARSLAEELILQEWDVNLKKMHDEEMDKILGVLDGP